MMLTALVSLYLYKRLAGASPVSHPNVKPAKGSSFSVALRPTVLAASFTVMLLWFEGFWKVISPPTPCAPLDAPPIVYASAPPVVFMFRLPCDLRRAMTSAPLPRVTLTKDVSAYLYSISAGASWLHEP